MQWTMFLVVLVLAEAQQMLPPGSIRGWFGHRVCVCRCDWVLQRLRLQLPVFPDGSLGKWWASSSSRQSIEANYLSSVV